MEDPIEVALRRKRDSSMRVAIQQLKEGRDGEPALAHACVSAGNTGALMAVAKVLLKTLAGIDRPAIAAVMPNAAGRFTTVLDLGANVDSTAENLLRPDKLVAYFESFEDLAAASAAASTEIRDLAPQGVPFPAEIAADGLLSWGIDPDPGERRRLGLGAESWRYWLVHRLARALAAAGRPEDASGSPERFALERLALEGIDVEHWIPRASSWWRADGG